MCCFTYSFFIVCVSQLGFLDVVFHASMLCFFFPLICVFKILKPCYEAKHCNCEYSSDVSCFVFRREKVGTCKQNSFHVFIDFCNDQVPQAEIFFFLPEQEL